MAQSNQDPITAAPTADEVTMRADGRRNYDRLLETARAAFAQQGTDVSLREVARSAGVGIGTLYRHFPTREALIEACMRHGLDLLCARAGALLDAPSPDDALMQWLHALAVSSATYQGLPGSLLAALQDETSELHRSCRAMAAAAGALLDRAQQHGTVRSDLATGDLLALAAAVAWAAQQTPDPERLRAVLLDAFRNGIADRQPAQ
ncbi:MAG TPA: helix-turn-helix domain-containing protein [Actinocrinis sp.]|nr:helix-turn-helix domain-containing protein [Actinocrinis sp.]